VIRRDRLACGPPLRLVGHTSEATDQGGRGQPVRVRPRRSRQICAQHAGVGATTVPIWPGADFVSVKEGPRP
jgi:hypothetical protein